MKSLIATLCILGVVGMVIGAAVLGATEATITATVTVQKISLTVADGSIAYGIIPAGSSKSTCDLDDTQTVTNNGNVAEDFSIKGKDCSWTLGSTPGSEVYVHKFATSSCGYINWNTAPALTTSYQTMATNIATSSSATLNLQITTPTATNSYTEQDVSVMVMAAAH
jgi:hypothetical protein